MSKNSEIKDLLFVRFENFETDTSENSVGLEDPR